ncbi:MAG: HAD family hydrolase [Proteobacteria bacterium]|nr:HAD family hydrolase [Pseudomonadota bacterium]MDA1023770.1 HAD family hydrolase [Pseudomonadota bacterium]
MPNEAPNPEDLPFGADLDSDGRWSQVLNRVQGEGRPGALFLDRDGVVVEEVHYLHQPDDVRFLEGAQALIGEANIRGIPVILVTNQAGIARGRFKWPQFIAVQEKIHDELAEAGVFLNAVFACPHHGDGKPPYDVAEHPWRKPNPGMLTAAAERLPMDLAKSWMIGDKASDIGAAKNAGLEGAVHVLTGHGKDEGERDKSLALAQQGFRVEAAATIADAMGLLPLFK